MPTSNPKVYFYKKKRDTKLGKDLGATVALARSDIDQLRIDEVFQSPGSIRQTWSLLVSGLVHQNKRFY